MGANIFLIWNLSIHIDFNFCFVFHTCVCVFFFFFSWSNNLYLKGNKNLSWFGNFTSGKNYSHHFNKKIAGAEQKKNLNTKQIQQQNFSTRLLHKYQQQVGDTPKVFSTHLRMDNSLTCGQNLRLNFISMYPSNFLFSYYKCYVIPLHSSSAITFLDEKPCTTQIHHIYALHDRIVYFSDG